MIRTESAPDHGPGAALVRVAWTAGRSEPDHRSELVTQWLCGEALAVEEAGPDGEWLRVRGSDGYRCWASAGGLLRTDSDEAVRWIEAADRLSLGVRLAERRPPATPGWLPWGARVALEGESVRLPDGAGGRPEPAEHLVAFGELERSFPARPDVVADTATGWLGAPYLWGGRTPSGVDCSGFVQSVYRVHGVELPRDSVDQLAATVGARVDGLGPADAGDGGAAAAEPGDLFFFGASEAEVDHVALGLGSDRIVHAAAPRGGVAADALGDADPLCRRLAERLVAVTRPLSQQKG